MRKKDDIEEEIVEVPDDTVKMLENIAWAKEKPSEKYKKLEKALRMSRLMVVSEGIVDECVNEEYKPAYKRIELSEDLDTATSGVIFVPLDYIPYQFT